MFEAHSSFSLASTRAPAALYPARRWLAILLLLTAGTCAAQTPAPLTMQQALDFARMQNPSLLSEGAHVTATKQSEITAGLRVNPNFSFNGQDVTLPASANNPYFYSAQVSRLFERGQKRRWRLDIARSTTDVTRSQYADQERQVVLAVKTAFTQMLAAKGALSRHSKTWTTIARPSI